MLFPLGFRQRASELLLLRGNEPLLRALVRWRFGVVGGVNCFANRRGKGSSCSAAVFGQHPAVRGPEFSRARPACARCDTTAFPGGPDIRARKRPAPTTSPPAKCTARPPASRHEAELRVVLFQFVKNQHRKNVSSCPAPPDFAVGTETVSGLRLVAERVLAPVEQGENDRRRHRAAGDHHQPLPERTPAQQRLLAAAQQKQNTSGPAPAALAAAPRTTGRTAVRAKSNRAADKSESRRQTAAGC
jgi:hypothetical protein